MSLANRWLTLAALARLALLAEASLEIGTGHVVETLSLARIILERGGEPVVWVNSDTPSSLFENALCEVEIVRDFSPGELRRVAAETHIRGIGGVVTNFRHISNEQIWILKGYGVRVLCIDELGGRRLDCDAIVNPSAVQNFHRYDWDNSRFQLYAGVAYLSLSEAFQDAHRLERVHRGRVRSVVVSMGGVDRTCATARLVEAISNGRPDVDQHVVIGSGYLHRDRLESVLAEAPAGRIVLHEKVSCLSDLFCGCDVGFTAGGNTLAELACVGTPALVASEDPHEDEQGKAFEGEGFGRWLGRCITVRDEQVQEALAALDDPNIRERQCRAGKALVDGKGRLRILEAIQKMLQDDTPVAS